MGGVVAPDSQEAFITEHYWGYTRQRDGSTIEYQVAHPAWRVWDVQTPTLEGEIAATYSPSSRECSAVRRCRRFSPMVRR